MDIYRLLLFKFGVITELNVDENWKKYFIENDYSGKNAIIEYVNGFVVRKDLAIDSKLFDVDKRLFKSNFEELLLIAAKNFDNYARNVQDKTEIAVNNGEEYEFLVKTVYQMPLLRGIYYSDDSKRLYWDEIRWNELKKRVGIHRVKVINNTIYIEHTHDLLGFANSTLSDESFRCNQVHLCLNRILKTIDVNSHDTWNNLGFLVKVFYHELAHCLFGHKGNDRDSNGIETINRDDEQHAQTYASIFFRSDEASQHIRAFSLGQPKEYQGMNLWWSNGELDSSNIYYKSIDANCCNKTNSKVSNNTRKGVMKMVKSQAIDMCIQKGIVLGQNVTFASLNRTGIVYWANPNVRVLQYDWTIILRDANNNELNVFQIPANTLTVSDFALRKDKNNLIDLQILYNDVKFEDKRSHIMFSKWYICTM